MKGEGQVKEKEKEFEEFLKEALKTIILPKSNMIHLVEIGNTLTKRDPLWKTKYNVKQLKKRIAKIEGYELVKKNGTDFIKII